MHFEGTIGIEGTTDRCADLAKLDSVNPVFFVDNGEIILSSQDFDYRVYRRSDMLIPCKASAPISVLNSIIMVNEEPVIKSSTLSTFTSDLLLSSTV